MTWLAVTVPTLVGLALAPTDDTRRTLQDAAAAGWPFALLAVAVGFAAHHHVGREPASAWLAAGLVVPPVAVGLASVTTALWPSTSTTEAARSLGLVAATFAVALVAFGGRASAAPRHPLLVGAAAAALTCGVSVLTSIEPVAGTGQQSIDLAFAALAATGLVGMSVLAVSAVVRRDHLPAWTRAALVLGGATVAAGSAVGSWLDISTVLVAVLHLTASVCFLAVALSLVAVLDETGRSRRRAELDRHRQREGALRQAQSILHEARATVAGLASATVLMSTHRDLDHATRDRLLALGRAELARLERMLAVERPTRGRADLGEALAPVVDSLRAQGHQVEVRTGAGQLHENADEVAHIVHLLLDNAARHGTEPIEVALERRDDDVLISVTDAGPGVPAHLRERLFDWGVSGSGSTGIGLHDGLTRAQALGGWLRLDEPADGRTCFELLLPVTTEAVR